MVDCQKCQSRSSEVSGIIRGVYYENLCKVCVSGQVSSAEASYDRQRDLEDHNGDMIQPYAGGEPNKEFMHLYPERSKQLFSPEQIDAAYRK